MKFDKRLFVYLLVVICLFAHIQVFSQGDNSGTILGSYRGVPAYSNGKNTGTGDGNLNYHCVAYMRRFYNDFIKYPITIAGDASTYFNNLSNIGFVCYPDGSEIPPTPDQILCFSGGGYGHVAIITEVNIDGGYIKIIDQNRTKYSSNIIKQLDLTVSNDHYNVGSFSKYYSVQGWACLPGFYYDGWHSKDQTSKAILDCYKKHGGKKTFGNPVDNRNDEDKDRDNDEYDAYVHETWPGSDVWCQDFEDNSSHIWHLMLDVDKTSAYPMHGSIANFYWNNDGPDSYGCPMYSEKSVTYVEIPDYPFDIELSRHQITVQGFQKEDSENGPRKTIIYDGRTGITSHNPVGSLNLPIPLRGTKWYIARKSYSDRKMYFLCDNNSDAFVWVSPGTYELDLVDEQNNTKSIAIQNRYT